MVNRPRARVVLTSTMSVDGKIAMDSRTTLLDPQGARRWRALHPPSASSAAAQRAADLLAAVGHSALLEGSGTFIADHSEGPSVEEDASTPRTPSTSLDDGDARHLYSDHLPTTPHADQGQHHVTRSWFIVIDSRGRIRWERTQSAERELLVLVAHATPADYLRFLQQRGISYLMAGEQSVDLLTALQRLHEVLRIQWVIADSGGTLNAALLRQGLVEQLHLLVLPALVGGRSTPTLVDGDPDDGPGQAHLPATLRLLNVHAEDDGLLRLVYAVGAISPSNDALEDRT